MAAAVVADAAGVAEVVAGAAPDEGLQLRRI
jgi:hypothetical protein